MSAREAMLGRRSLSRVTDAAPTHDELADLVSAAGRVADHSSLRPWRLIELRGDDRRALGRAIHESEGKDGESSKPLRAPLLIAVVARIRRSGKVPDWEQEAVAAGVAHVLSLLLDEAGWGVIWRTGGYTRSAAVAAAHGLGEAERLLGWLYVGGKPDREKRPGHDRGVDGEAFLSTLDAPPAATPARRTHKGDKHDRTRKKGHGRDR
ncbi:MAG: nitroreductase family protein [Microbacterium sp.]|uniref:nitroreductase family protein n=1 Tax=Microbacterium sp. TaxID=51671 RepID=UPI0039E5B35D